MSIKLVQLKSFCALMQDPEYSVTKTAESIHIDHTALSRQISSLEDSLGLQLFDRSEYKKLKPTKDGQEFYKEIIVNYQGLDSSLKNYSKEMEEAKKNQINIAGLDVIFTRMLPIIKEFKEQNPHVDFSLSNTTMEEAFASLRKNKVDLVFYPRDMDDDCPIEINKTEIQRLDTYWVLYKGHSLASKDENDITLDEIANYPFGILSRVVYSKFFKKFIDSYELKTPLNVDSGGTDFLKALVRNKMCITIFDELFVNELDRKDFILKKSPVDLVCYIFFLKNIKRKEIVKKFLNVIYEEKDKIFA